MGTDATKQNWRIYGGCHEYPVCCHADLAVWCHTIIMSYHYHVPVWYHKTHSFKHTLEYLMNHPVMNMSAWQNGQICSGHSKYSWYTTEQMNQFYITGDQDQNHPHSSISDPRVQYRFESWAVKKADRGRNDLFEIWCWRRALQIPNNHQKDEPVSPRVNQAWTFSGDKNDEIETVLL